MKNFMESLSFNPRVAAVRVSPPDYDDRLPGSSIGKAIELIGESLGWSSPEGGVLGGVVPSGARVLIKPNWVMHENQGPWGLDPLITHASLIRAIVEAALRTEAAEVLIGDAPLQGCDFEQLLSDTGLKGWSEELARREPRFRGIRDFRRTTCIFVEGVRMASEDVQETEKFVLFDLADHSLLEPITNNNQSFRVTCYDPRLLAKTHAPGRHQYLVAREILEADVVIDLPKLKTHMKAGITCALKNLIGINGNKEYLPHHRIGGLQLGGDCYPGHSNVKRALEFVLDRQNTTKSFAIGRMWRGAANHLYRLLHLQGDQLGIEGAWSGNDTIWRTCLDLNRILLYGRPDATMAESPQRRVIHIVDAVIAGQGNGPLAPQPLPLGLILGGASAPAVDWVGAQLLGYDPDRIPVVRQSMGSFRWPLTTFGPEAISVVGNLGSHGILEEGNHNITYPLGWRDAVRTEQKAWADATVRTG